MIPHETASSFCPWVAFERGGLTESVAFGLLVVIDDEGRERARWGDPAWPVFLRSSVKPVQALPLIESGAADELRLEPRHVAVCAASHSGEPGHRRAVRDVLERAGHDEALFHCGAHAPFHESSAADLVRAGEVPRPVHNNCSGKHAGMMAACRARGWDVATYWKREHPLQREIATILGSLADVDPDAMPHGIDGCGLPTFRLAAVRFAIAMARFAAGTGPAEPHRRAAGRIFEAMSRHPEMVGGAGRFCTEVNRAANRPVIAKAGAEGLYLVAWREDSGRGLALVAKAAAADERSRNFAVTEAMRQLGLIEAEGLERMRPFWDGPIHNHAGEEVGRRVSLLDLG